MEIKIASQKKALAKRTLKRQLDKKEREESFINLKENFQTKTN